MKYTVSIAVDARVDIEVEAESFAEAKSMAEVSFCDALYVDEDLRPLDVIGWKAVNATREDDQFKDY